MAQFLAILACGAVLVQGGYFPAFFLWVGAALGAALAVSPRRLSCPLPMALLGGLSGWYLLAAIVAGGGRASLGQAALPLVCWLYGLAVLSLTEAERRRTLVWIARFGCGAAGAAILAFFGVIPLDGAVTARRLQFTFQYVNAAGIWFAAILLLRGELKDRWVDRLWPLALAALLLTRSAGAVGLYLLLQLLVWLTQAGRKRPGLWVGAGVLTLAGAAAIATRFQQVLGTFQERLVQSLDAGKGILAAPVFGYGAGNWPQVKPLFQSYEYRAQVVHNSYAQAGVEAGLPAVVLLGAAVVLALLWTRGRSRSCQAAAVLIPLHGLMDFTLCFFAVDGLLLTVLALAAPEDGRQLPQWAGKVLGILCAVFFVVLAVMRLAG